MIFANPGSKGQIEQRLERCVAAACNRVGVDHDAWRVLTFYLTDGPPMQVYFSITNSAARAHHAIGVFSNDPTYEALYKSAIGTRALIDDETQINMLVLQFLEKFKCVNEPETGTTNWRA